MTTGDLAPALPRPGMLVRSLAVLAASLTWAVLSVLRSTRGGVDGLRFSAVRPRLQAERRAGTNVPDRLSRCRSAKAGDALIVTGTATTLEPMAAKALSGDVSELKRARALRLEAERKAPMSERLARVHALSKQLSAIKGAARVR